MELYAKSVSQATFKLPTSDTSVTGVTYSFNGGTPVALSSTITSGVASVTLPYLQSEGELVLAWSINIPLNGAFVENQYFEIVTPYLSISEIKEIDTDATDAEAKKLEAAVRHIINAHCGQSFGYAIKSLTVEGHGERALRLPERLIELTSFATRTAQLDPTATIIVSDGWYLKKGWATELSTIVDTSTYWQGFDSNDFDAVTGPDGVELSSHGAIIVPPGSGSTPTVWRDDYPFSLTGKWGYLYVPEPVKEAAKLLTNDYACMEIAYRDRYLESIKAADWRLQFSSRAWEHTGNVRADQLLSEYVLLDWAVI